MTLYMGMRVGQTSVMRSNNSIRILYKRVTNRLNKYHVTCYFVNEEQPESLF